MTGRTEAETGFWPAAGLLPGLVTSTTGYRDDGPAQPLHRGLPSPYLTFIFSLADPIVTGESWAQATGPDAHRTRVVVGGLHRRPAFIVPDRSQEGLQLSVHPLAARTLFGAPTVELTDLVTEGVDVLGPDVERLRVQLHAETSWAGRFALLQGYLRRRVDRAHRVQQPRKELVEAWRWLGRRRGVGSMDGLARHVGLSPRQLSTVFRREVGMGPKQVAGLMRFDHARQLVAVSPPGPSLDLTAVALRSGFYDHAHLDRDFLAYSGISPTGWLAEERRNIQAGGHRNGEDWTS